MSADYSLTVRSAAVYVFGAAPSSATVCVRDGRIAAIEPYGAVLSSAEDVDLGPLSLLPGLVDTHVHVNEPGRTEWEGFATATAAAAAGGVTTLIDMPLNSIPPTVTVDALRAKQSAAGGQCHVDVGFWGGAIPGNLADLAALHEAGVFGFKCFTSPSGVDEFPHLDWPRLPPVLDTLARLDAMLIAHAEDPAGIGPFDGTDRFADFLASRPPAVEDRAVRRLAAAALSSGARVHVVHLSSASAVPIVAAARRAGTRITAETCPHYLTLAAEDVPDGATRFKCCPPIRGRDNASALWAALADGTLMGVVSDHSPCPAALKDGDFGQAWGGIASVQLGLPVVWTEARRRGHTLGDVVRWMSAGPAALVGLNSTAGLSGSPGSPGSAGSAGSAGFKGRIAVGADADLVAFDPDASFTVDASLLHHRHPITPYDGAHLTGVVHHTWLRGRPCGGGADPAGRLLRRT